MQQCPFLLTNCIEFSLALADHMETREVWEVAGPVVGSLVFILIVLGGAILLWRRRKLRTKRQDEPAEEKIEMNSNSPSPERTTVTYSLVPKSQKETPTVV